MNVPREKEWLRFVEAMRSLQGSPKFQVFLDWIRNERDARDAENRVPGQENKTSEAQALTKILNTVEAAVRVGNGGNGTDADQ